MAIMAGAINVLLAVVLFAQYRFNRSYPGLGWWAAGQAAVAAGIIVSTLRGDSLAGRVAVPIYQAMLVLGAAWVYVGVQRFLGRRERWGWLVAVWLVLVSWSMFHTFANDDATLRAIGLYLTLAVLLASTSAVLWRHRLPSVQGSATFLSVVFAAAALSYLSLAVAEPMRSTVGNPLFAPSPVNAGAFLTAIASTLLWTFGLVVMINQRLAAEIAVDARNMHSVFATSPDCAITSRMADGVIDDVNVGFTRLSGFDRDEVIGKSAIALGLWADPQARDVMVRQLADAGTVTDFPMVLCRKDGSRVDCLLAASMLTLEDEPYLIAVIRDVTQQRRMEAELLHEATTDGLTGLPNRRHFLSVCERELRRAARSGGAVAVAVVDIDHFKEINDTHGHATGDAAVRSFAEAVTSHLRDIDTCGRLGGDEFGILLPDADVAHAVAAVERVRAELASRPCLVGHEAITLTFSAGVADVTRVDDTVDTVLARADAALYIAKAQGRDRVAAALPEPETAAP